jgi:hypothetical protein
MPTKHGFILTSSHGATEYTLVGNEKEWCERHAVEVLTSRLSYLFFNFVGSAWCPSALMSAVKLSEFSKQVDGEAHPHFDKGLLAQFYL